MAQTTIELSNPSATAALLVSTQTRSAPDITKRRVVDSDVDINADPNEIISYTVEGRQDAAGKLIEFRGPRWQADGAVDVHHWYARNAEARDRARRNPKTVVVHTRLSSDWSAATPFATLAPRERIRVVLNDNTRYVLSRVTPAKANDEAIVVQIENPSTAHTLRIRAGEPSQELAALATIPPNGSTGAIVLAGKLCGAIEQLPT